MLSWEIRGRCLSQSVAGTVEKKRLGRRESDGQRVLVVGIARFLALDDDLLVAGGIGVDVAGIAEMFGDVDIDGQVDIAASSFEEMFRTDAERHLFADVNSGRGD